MIEVKADIDFLIRKNENALSAYYSQMETLRLEFIKQVTTFAADWYMETAKAYITKYPEITLGMKEENILKMKRKISEFAQNTGDIVEKELSNPNLWWHQTPNINDSIDKYVQVADKYPSVLDRAVRHITGRLGCILEEFKFNVTTNPNNGLYPEFWFDSQPNAEPEPFYPHLLKWSFDMEYTIQKYNTQFIAALLLFKETQYLRDQKKKQLASARWDSL